jgi:hypothetical protein
MGESEGDADGVCRERVAGGQVVVSQSVVWWRQVTAFQVQVVLTSACLNTVATGCVCNLHEVVQHLALLHRSPLHDLHLALDALTPPRAS